MSPNSKSEIMIFLFAEIQPNKNKQLKVKKNALIDWETDWAAP